MPTPDDPIAAIRAARHLIKPNPTPSDEAEYRDKGYGVSAGFEGAVALLADIRAEMTRWGWSDYPGQDPSIVAMIEKLDRALGDPPANTPDPDAMKVAVCEYLLDVNRGFVAKGGSPLIPLTAVNWLGDGIVSAILTPRS